MDRFEVGAHITTRCLDGFKEQAAELIRITKEKDTRTLRYDWFVSGDGTECEVRETHSDQEGNDENVAWDATKKAWRSCVSERLGEAWTVVQRAKKQCYPREKKLVLSRVTAQGTEIVSCGAPGGDPRGRWVCLLNAVPCTAPTTP